MQAGFLLRSSGYPNFPVSKVSDGYHTFEELYEIRMAYNVALAHAAHALGVPVHKSLRHHDGQLCFGGGWFIVVIETPQGPVSNHYDAKHWDLFKVPECEQSTTPYDGHTTQDSIKRLMGSEFEFELGVN